MNHQRQCFEEAWPVSLVQELLGAGFWEPGVELLVRQVLSFGKFTDETVVFVAAYTCNALLPAEIDGMRQQVRRKKERLLALLNSTSPGERAEALEELGICAGIAYAALCSLLHERKARSALATYVSRLQTLGYALDVCIEKPVVVNMAPPVAVPGF